jgi:alkaline phosphatase D
MPPTLQAPDRRHLLQLAAATATTLWLPRSAWSQPRLSGNPFTLGVASGSPTHDGVVLWTRLALSTLFGSVLGKEPFTVRWEIAHDEAFQRTVQRGQVQAVVELAHAVHVEVQGLEPDRWYHYRFMVGGVGNDWVSPVGRTRTFPAPGADAARLRLGYASCQRWEHGYFSAHRHLAQEQLDAVMFLGDYIYEYPAAGNAVRLPSGGWVLTLDDYRQRYAQHKGEADLQAAHAACPWLVTWDDHEVQNDYAGLNEGENGPAVANFAARRAAAYQAFYEHMPLRASSRGRSVVWRRAPRCGSTGACRLANWPRWSCWTTGSTATRRSAHPGARWDRARSTRTPAQPGRTRHGRCWVPHRSSGWMAP